MSLSIVINGDAIDEGIPPGSIAVQSMAKDGETGFGGFTIEDPGALLATTGHKLVTIEETACSQPRLFTGYVTERSIGRSEDNALLAGEDRQHDLQVVDVNAVFNFRIITYAGGKRPEETMAQRLTWLLGYQALVQFVKDTGHIDWGILGLTIDAADYTGATPKAVLDDLVGRRPSITYFAFWDPVAKAVGLYFGGDSVGITESALSISNDIADINPTAGVYPPDSEAKLRRSPEEVYSEVMVTYAHGTKRTYRKRGSTSAAYVARGTTIERPYTGRLTTAQSQAEAFLDNHAEETDTISVTILVYPEDAGLVTAGQRINVKFTHLPDYEAWTSMRVVSVNVRPSNDVANRYYLDLELEKPRAGTGPSDTCTGGPYAIDDAAHNIALGKTVTTASTAGNPAQNPWYAVDGNILNYSGPSAGVVVGAGTYYDLFTIDLGESRAIGIVAFKGACPTHNADRASAYTFLLSDSSDGSTGSTSGTFIDNDFGIWSPPPSDYSSWTPASPTQARYVHIRHNWTQGLSYHAGTSMNEILVCTSDIDDQEEQAPPSTPAGTPVQSASDPTSGDDVADGHQVGQLWINTTTGDTFVLTDGTEGAAVWTPLTNASPALDDLTDVNAPAPDDGDVLTWDATPGEWIAAPPAPTVSPASTVESETTWAITPAVGSDTEYARQDHTHGSPANPVSGSAVSALGFVGELLISDTPSTPLVFADLIQNEAQDDLIYADV